MRVKGMLRRTIEFCDGAILLDPANSKAYFRRGCALETLEKYKDARDAYLSAMQLAPNDAGIRKALQRCERYCGHKNQVGEDWGSSDHATATTKNCQRSVEQLEQ